MVSKEQVMDITTGHDGSAVIVEERPMHMQALSHGLMYP